MVCVADGTDLPDAPAGDDAPADGLVPPDGAMVTRVVIGLVDGELADTAIGSGYAGSPDGAGDHMSVDVEETGLVRFELSSLPTSTVVVAATLRIATSDAADAGGGTVTVHRLRESWNELEATWLARKTGLGWLAAGALPPARDAAVLATFTPAALDTSYDVTLPAALVQAWISTPTDNHGIALVRGTATDHIHLASREHGVPASLLLDVIAP